MGAYETYLKRMLAPLGVYHLEDGTFNECELYSLGEELDAVCDRLDMVQTEALMATACGEGLDRREALLARRPAASTAEQRRAALAALFQINEDSLTMEAINQTIGGCGIAARAQETEVAGKIRILFPQTAGVPEGIEQIRKIILDIIPCHLETEFYFRYLTWQECEEQGLTWELIETAQHTWASLELAIPSEG